MSSNVAKALVCLGKRVSYVGGDGQPPTGSEDSEIAAAVKQQRRVLVTYNFDMVLAACAAGVRFIWFDQRGRSPTMLETAAIFLRQWETWEEKLADTTVRCLKAGRGSSEVLSVEDAYRRAFRRDQRVRRRKAREAKREADSQQGRLVFDEEEEG